MYNKLNKSAELQQENNVSKVCIFNCISAVDIWVGSENKHSSIIYGMACWNYPQKGQKVWNIYEKGTDYNKLEERGISYLPCIPSQDIGY